VWWTILGTNGIRSSTEKLTKEGYSENTEKDYMRKVSCHLFMKFGHLPSHYTAPAQLQDFGVTSKTQKQTQKQTASGV